MCWRLLVGWSGFVYVAFTSMPTPAHRRWRVRGKGFVLMMERPYDRGPYGGCEDGDVGRLIVRALGGDCVGGA